MVNLIDLLESCSHSDLLLAHNDIVIALCIDPSDFFQAKTSFSKLIDLLQLSLSLQYLESIIGSLLFWLIDSLNDQPDTILIMRILGIIPVKEPNSLLSHMFLLNPKLDEF